MSKELKALDKIEERLFGGFNGQDHFEEIDLIRTKLKQVEKLETEIGINLNILLKAFKKEDHCKYWALTRNEKLGLELSRLLISLRMNPNYNLNDEEQMLLETIIDKTKFAIVPMDLIKEHSLLNIYKENELSTMTLTFQINVKSSYVDASKEFEQELKDYLLELLVDSISVL